MSGIALDVRIDDSPVSDMLARLVALGRDPSPALDAIGAAMVAVTETHFDEGVAPDGVAWKPSQRIVKGGGGKTLVLSTRLWRSFTHNVIGAAVEWGTNVIYAAIHQFGGTITREPHTQTIYRKADADGIAPGFVKKRKSNFAQDVAVAAFSITIPARPMVGFGNEEAAEALDILKRYLGGALTGATP